MLSTLAWSPEKKWEKKEKEKKICYKCEVSRVENFERQEILFWKIRKKKRPLIEYDFQIYYPLKLKGRVF